jgi:hypothetical protein
VRLKVNCHFVAAKLALRAQLLNLLQDLALQIEALDRGSTTTPLRAEAAPQTTATNQQQWRLVHFSGPRGAAVGRNETAGLSYARMQ